MRLCRRRATLDNFIKWCYSSSRDLPSFYDATAEKEGENPQNSHATDNLLLKQSGLIYLALKYANAAVAEIICHEVEESISQELNDDEWNKRITELLVEAYKCFSRLNCPIDGNLWQSTQMKQQMFNGDIMEVEALCKVFMALKGISSKPTIQITWEQKMLLISSAIKEAHELLSSTAAKSSAVCQKKKRKRKECSENSNVN